MKMLPVRAPKERKPRGFWFQALSTFADSDSECLVFIPDEGEYRGASTLQSTISGCIRRYHFNMTTKRENDRVYVIKTIRKDCL